MVRAPFFDENGVKKGAWSQEEDDKLKAYIEKYGHWNWRELPKFAGLQRCGKSCRLRWMNYLRPGVKHGNYSKEEEEMIIELHEKFGNKWSKIAAKLPGRTDNEIKNYWHTHLKRRTRSSECESSSSGSEGKQYSPLDHNEDPMVVEESCVRDMPSYLILESSPLTPVSSSTEFQHFTCDSSATISANWNIPQDSISNNDSPMSQFEPLDYCSGDFWTQPFVLDLGHNYHYRPCVPQDEFEPNSYFANFEDAGDLFYQVMNELP